MKRLALLMFAGFGPLAMASNYSYSIYNSSGALFQQSNLTNWNSQSGTTNGSVSCGVEQGMCPLYNNGSSGSLIYTQTSLTAYEVALGLDNTFASGGGVVTIYLHASSNALRSTALGSDTGTFDAISLYTPSCASDGTCTVNLAYYERSGGSTAIKAYTVIPYQSEARFRAVAYGTTIGVLVNNTYYSFVSGLSGGYPGVGVSLNTTGVIDLVQMGPQCTTLPTAVNSNTIAYSAYPTSVSMSWPEPVQPPDVAAVGIVQWYTLRNGSFYGQTDTAAAWADPMVSPSTSYTYAVTPMSFHGVAAAWSTAITVETPSTSSIDPRRTGVKPLGAYWGASPEQIDVESGNLNLTVPIIQAQGRGGWTVPLSLSYNSQNWKQDAAGVEMSSIDVGYGQGWKMMAGSLTPYWNSQMLTIDHYLYIDSTGAEYRLYPIPGGPSNVWTSQLYPSSNGPSGVANGEGIYVYYDSNTGLLHFRDGSFWVMGCTSSGDEQDAGTLYPTVIEDRNGNQVLLTYASGINTTYPNSSARISIVADTRAQSGVSYEFFYNPVNASGVPHIGSIGNYIGTDETYWFYYTGSPLTITDPFGQGNNYPNITELTNVTDQINFTRQFGYTTSGEVNSFELPNGGTLQWAYQSNEYIWSSPSTNHIYERAVVNRYLDVNANAFSLVNANPGTYYGWQYTMSYNSYATGDSVFPNTCLTDVTAAAMRCWSFANTDSTTAPIGMVTDLKRETASGTVLRDDALTYALDPANNPYVAQDLTTDSTGPSPVYSQKQQQLDQYGNVTLSSIWDWSTTAPSGSTGWKRQYQTAFDNACTNPFTSGSSGANCSYVNKFILNLLASQTLTDSQSNTITLQSNTFDSYAAHPLTSVSGLTEFDSSYGTSYTTRGNITQSVVPGATTNTYYDMTGMPTGADDNNSHAIAVTAASGTNNSAPGLIQPNTGSSNDANLATSLTYSTFLGVSSATAPNSSLTTVAYDSQGRPLTALAATGASTGYVYAFGTTTSGGSISNGPYTTTATTNTHWATTITDGLGRTITSQTGYLTGTTSTPVSEVDTVYAPCACSPTGKPAQVSQPYAPGGTPVYTVYGYDALGRTLTIQLPDGASTTHYLYQGNWTTVTDPAGNWKQYESDIFGNTIVVVEPDPSYTPLVTTAPNPPSTTASGILVTNYTYDFVNHLTNVSMVRAGVTQTRTSTYSPTTLFLTSTTSPETGTSSGNGTTSYVYNADGTLHTRTDPKGQVTTYTYDNYQRVTQVTHGSDATQTYNYTYDTGTNGYGRLTQVTWGGTCGGFVAVYTESYSYTVAGEVSGKTLSVAKKASNGNCYQIPITGSFTYDNEGKTTGITYPEFVNGVTAPAVSYSYDNMSRLTGVTDANEALTAGTCSWNGTSTWASGGTYNAAGQLTGVKRLQSVTYTACPVSLTNNYFNQAWQYNALNQLTEIDTSTQFNGYPEGVPSPGAATYFFAKYTFSATANNGQITGMQDSRTGSTVTYTYDLLKRVTSAAGSGGSMLSQTFGYDGFGNLTSKSVPAGSSEFPLPGVNANKNWLNGSTYDQNGNVTTLNNATLSYDVENRLSEYTTGSFVENYAYDERSERVDRWSGTTYDNVYFYGPNGKLLTVVQLNFNPTAPYVTASTLSNRIYFGKMLLGTTNGQVNTDSSLIKDRLGSVQPSYPYGTATGSGEQTSPGDDFATYWKDSSTGFEYARNRYYSTGYGRFLTVDPFGGSGTIKNPGSWNRYSYAEGDPINESDPSGLLVQDCDWNGCAFNPWAAAGSLTGDNVGSFGSGGISFVGPLWALEAAAEAQYAAYVYTVVAVAGGMPVAAGVLGANGGANPCAGLFNLPSGVTPQSLLSQINIVYEPLQSEGTFAEEFDPTDQGNPDPGAYTVVFNTDVGNPNIKGGSNEASLTLIHELIHVVYGEYGPSAAPTGWVNDDGGDDAASGQAEAGNNAIVQNNCSPTP
jgi:RHS repeat-associated protein